MTAVPGPAARRAEALGARLPPLLVAAERVAATVAQGVHGRRRVGQGDSFWQYRPFVAGDLASRIDGRASGKSDRNFVRETEWEAAQSVSLWRDGSPSMHWRSGAAVPEKVERAELLLLALASLLLRGGERVRLMGVGRPARGGRAALDGLAESLATVPPLGLPAPGPLPRFGRVVLIGDFLSPLADIQAFVAGLAGAQVSGHLLQVLDPAEVLLPYAGRVRFRGLEREADAVVPRVQGIRDGYAQALAAQQSGLAALCGATGWSFAVHRTDHPPEAALLGLHVALGPA